MEVNALNARTSILPDYISPLDGEYDVNGVNSLKTLLHVHKPLSVVVLGLGTNDIKDRYNQTHRDIVNNVRVLMKNVWKATSVGIRDERGVYYPPRILVLGVPQVLSDHPGT